jgi:hypothetical protein
MEEASARAGLASSPAFEGGLTTTISRSEVEKALRMDEPPDLVLDVTQFSEGKTEETRKIAITWDPEDLERLLRDTAGETITLTFDRETLWQALESDVEAHGMREKVVVLAIAGATAFGVGAGAASAALDEGGVSATQSSVIAPDNRADRTVVPPADTGVVAADDRADRMVPTTGFDAPSVLPDDRAVRTVTPADEPSVRPDDRAVRTVTPADQPSVRPDDRAVRTVTPADTPSVRPDDRAVRTVTPQPAPVQADDGGITIEAPSPEAVAGIAGAIALAITGAAFIARSRRAPGQPA